MNLTSNPNLNELNVLILLFPGKPSLRCKIILKDFNKRVQAENPSWVVWGAFTTHEPLLGSVIDEVAMAMDENSRNRISILPMFIMPGQMTEFDLPKAVIDKKKQLPYIEFSLLKAPSLIDELLPSFSSVIHQRLER